MRRTHPLAATGLLALLPLASCNVSQLLCGAEEERWVTVNSDPTVAYTRAGTTTSTPIALQTRITEFDLGEASFATLFRAVDDGASVGQGIVLPLAGTDSATNASVLLVLALPTPLRSNTVIPVGSAFQVPRGDLSRGYFAPRPLADPARAEVALSVGTYHFPPPEWRTSFAATGASGTVRVGRDYNPGFELQLDLTLTDGAGRVVRIADKAGVFTSRYTPPCT